MKSFLKYVLTYIVLVVIFLGALLIVSCIPQKVIQYNAKKSAVNLIYESEKVYFRSLGRNLFDDNSSDAIMFNLAYTIDEENKMESIIKARRNFIPGITKEIKPDMVGNLPHENNVFSMTREFLNTVNDKEQVSYEYARYWHGYIVILRLLLCVFDISVIRLLTQITILILISILMYFLIKNTNWKIAVALFLAFVAADLFVWIYTLHGRYVVIVALLISIFIANKKINEKNINIWLFVSGALTAYFDLLTTPIFSALLPIVIYTAVNTKDTTIKSEIIRLIKNFAAWGIGYLGLWATKWVISDLLYDTEIIKVSLTQIYYRLFGNIKKSNIGIKDFKVLKLNVKTATNYLTIALYICMFAYAIIKKKRSRKNNMFLSAQKLPYFLCIIITIAWYLVVSEHSNRHYFFTYKTMLIPLLSTMLIVLDDKNVNKLLAENNEKKEIDDD